MTLHHTLLGFSVCLFGCFSTAWAQEKPATAELLIAAEKADAQRVRLLLNTLTPDCCNAQGQTPLMLAAKAGHFEICRALLWSGADANAVDKAEKKARDCLTGEAAGFSPVNLLLRCYSFVQNHHMPAKKITRPGLVMISDSFIDYDHTDLKANYWINQAEAAGKAGKDDDGNGFIDDVYGWNAAENTPLRTPLLANMADEINATLLKKFITLHNLTKNPEHPIDNEAWKGLKLEDLETSYDNPLVRQLGFEIMKKGALDINDLAFTNMLVGASHGTHVAGIVLKASDGRAQLHGMMHGRFQAPQQSEAELLTLARKLAPRTISYEQFIMKLRQTLLADAVQQGQQRSAYLASTGAGVANLSWGQTKTWFLETAQNIQDIYQKDGMDPDSIERYTCPVGLDLCGDLGLELLVNAAAELALMFHDNPDVLFVLSAANDGANNDEELPSPAYLSRFFPNVITVACVDENNDLSNFSNYGLASVQVAAPGENIYSSFLSNQFGYMSGTSMAAPAVAGLAARIRATHPHLTASDVRLILERTVTQTDELQEKISSGGVVNPDAALALAAKWQPGSRADLTLAAITPPRLSVEEKPMEIEPEDEHTADDISTTAKDKGARITAIGGFANQARIIMSTGTDFTQQAAHPVGKLPIEWIKDKWADGFEITSINGEHDNWRVVMSANGTAREQKLLGLDFDQQSIDDLLSIGYRITSHAGFGSSWVFVLTDKTGWKEQLYTLPGAFDDERQQWITKNLAAGYRITSLAGDEYGKDRKQDAWSLVMTRGTALGPQVISGPAAWPQAWITEHAKKGFQITHCSGFADHWIVVMTQNTALQKQTTSTGGAWDDAWVKELWKAAK